ncbi:GNAT family N-acetyltransferase [Intrasporangium calvum]|uniref:GCN5-related N-acetyltransferase n=1 Tax=Intrasporangium calvum (strain ATCC 23552 / DSM 43043 / JCM 3097 / NBRC 12989 / NCIMB 10167 / NRRL B-3866 / 7 KIP) TaxID=710696 RepID=E6SDF5_INTC7|nr:GNAT family N-acetyltransferase [Intrasporangium calvum]ADU47577.1 GCN5-related N-acetyltransferase [Intrasporangium calvum DSM 43043]
MPDSATPSFTIRPATVDDVDDLARLVRELAHYERDPDAAVATADHFREALFPREASPAAYAHVAERDGLVVGMAVWFASFSTWTGRRGLWLEDLFVEPAQRGLGIGKALLTELARVCTARGWTRLEWVVLDWNAPAIEFYRSQGAQPLTEWTTYRVAGDALGRLAGGSPS